MYVFYLWLKAYILALKRQYTNANKQQNKYKYKHWILVFGCSWSYNTPMQCSQIIKHLTCGFQFVNTIYTVFSAARNLCGLDSKNYQIMFCLSNFCDYIRLQKQTQCIIPVHCIKL